MPYIEINDKNQIVGISKIPQEGFTFVKKIPTDKVNIFDESKKLKTYLSELKESDYKILSFLEKKESGKKTKLSKIKFKALSDSRDQLRNKIEEISKIIGV